MRITTKGRYALRAVIALAVEAGSKPVSISYLAEKEQLSAKFLEQLFFRLKNAGIISSERGPKGGFMLKKAPEEISINDIFSAVDEKTSVAPCQENPDHSSCGKSADCKAYKIWNEITGHINTYFDSISLKDIIEKY
jgi:Rrf2 family iron-sulfur cluster assembly transcriptional regulator